MNFVQFLRKTVGYFWSLHLTAALGAAVTAAVLTGALVVGDSMRFSLRRLTLDRLGRVDQAMTGPYWLTNASAERLASSPEFTAAFDAVVPVIRLYAALQRQSPDGAAAGHVQVLGCDARFWSAMGNAPPQPPGPREIVLNRQTAELLGATPGDRLILRLPRLQVVPGESVFGRKADTIESTVVTVKAIIEDDGAGRFALEPSQQAPRNAFVDSAWLAERLNSPDTANVWLITGKRADRPAAAEAERRLGEISIFTADDLGLRWEESPRGYVHLTSRRMLLAPSLRRLVESRLKPAAADPVFFYLLETVRAGTHAIYYATAAALELAPAPPLGPFPAPDGTPVATPGEDEVVLNTWAAEQLHVAVGDTVEVTWFDPEQTGGEVRRTTRTFRVSGITAIAEAADDPKLMPEVAGLTDRRSIADWDPPFPFDAGKVTPADEEYWERHRGTPKAYFSPKIAARYWANRWGDATSLRILPPPNVSPNEIRSRLRFSAEEAGITLLPVKRQGLAASAGTTSFGMLFLGFNMFVMTAGLLLTSLLFRLGIEKQTRQLGVLSAVGWPPRRLLIFLLGQACVVSLLGGILGVPLGLGYAAAFVAGLNTIWLPAVAVPFLRFHAGAGSLLIGGCAGVLTAVVVTTWALLRLVRAPTRELLSGGTGEVSPAAGVRSWRTKLEAWIALACFLLALGAATLGVRGDEMQQALAFFLVGLLILAGAMLALLARLHRSARQARAARSLGGLALRNAARNPTRSTLSLGMTAAACFLIFSVAAFRLDPSQSVPAKDGGNGGFWLLGETDQPIFADLNAPDGRRSLGFSPQDARRLDAVRIVPLRLQSGEDAGCLNLYRPHQPRVLGVPKALRQRDGFSFAAGMPKAAAPGPPTNPWHLLDMPDGGNPSPTTPIPAILDDATVKYSLNLSGVGAEFEILDGRGHPVRLRVVATLQNSIFQGNVLIAEEAFIKLFPDTTGYRYFLVEPRVASHSAAAPNRGEKPQGEKTAQDWREEAHRVQRVLERQCLDYGMTMTLTTERQAALLAVQNTYLSTFQSLGALGLLLGTFGLAAAQIRSVAERQSELALLRAVGFRDVRIRNLIVLENLVLLGGGLALGTASAAAAVLPQWFLGRAFPSFTTLLWIVPISLAVGLISAALAGRQLTALPLIGALRRE
ncbi:MAG: FtsX-like permease family protein [Thermogutta sp.]